MFDMVDTVLCYGRALIVCKFLQESFMVKQSSLHEIRNADTVFLLGGAEQSNGNITRIINYRYGWTQNVIYQRKIISTGVLAVRKIMNVENLLSQVNLKGTGHFVDT